MILNEHKPPGPFQTMEAIREYRSGDRIQCLVCGRYFRRLQYMHLISHEMTADDYRAAFGIPWNTSLTSEPSRKASSSKMTPERIEAFKLYRETFHPRPLGNRRRTQAPAVRNQWHGNAKLGRYLALETVTTGCATCGIAVETTALCAAQPIHCLKCATKGSLKARAYYRRKQQQLQQEDLAA